MSIKGGSTVEVYAHNHSEWRANRLSMLLGKFEEIISARQYNIMRNSRKRPDAAETVKTLVVFLHDKRLYEVLTHTDSLLALSETNRTTECGCR